MGGRLTFPGGGIYHASKHAVEALGDALRFEVRGFGIDVVTIEPGLIRTEFGETAVGSLGAADAQSNGGPYGEFNAAVGKATAEAYENGPAVQARRRARRRRAHDRAGDQGTPPARPLPRDGVGEAAAGAAADDARPRVGRVPALAVPAAEGDRLGATVEAQQAASKSPLASPSSVSVAPGGS